MSGTPQVEILADHSALLAIPAFAPAIMIVAVVVWVARRDRRLADEEDAHSTNPASANEDGSP